MKLKLAAKFITIHSINKEQLYLDIIGEIEDLRKCYELDATQSYNDDELAWMFLIDGCVVLLYIYSRYYVWGFNKMEILKSKELEIIEGVNGGVEFTMDLLLLENQLPYRVLKLLVDANKNSTEELMEAIKMFIAVVSYNGVEDPDKLVQVQLPPKEPSHLLDLMRTSLIRSASSQKKSSFIVRELKPYKMQVLEMVSGILGYLIFVLLYFLPDTPILNLTSMHNVGEPKEAGIKLKSSGKCYFTDINFSYGTLKLPSIRVNKLTIFKFLNLVAYVLSLDCDDNKFEVSTYIQFLQSLIIRAEDVKELRDTGILTHIFDSDEDVVKLFKEIRIDDMPLPFDDSYCDITEEIHKHCGKKYNAWMAQLKNKYFESPWSVIALVGATIALAVTILQTVYTILAYYEAKPTT